MSTNEKLNKKKKIILRAPFLCAAGYGVHARQIAKWLLDKVDASPDSFELVMDPVSWGDTPWIVNPEAENGLIQRILEKCIKKKDDSYDVSFQLQLPNEWNPFLADKNIGISAVVEADKCNPQWIENCNRMDLIITPSEFSKKVLKNSGNLDTSVVVVPESFPEEILDNSLPEINIGLETDFNFLIFGQITGNSVENDRKNLFYTIKWLCEEFEGREDVGVVVKTNLGRQSALDRTKTASLLSQLLMQVKKSEKGPKIYLLHGAMNNKEIASLYKHPKIKALVSLTRGEGFGLPLLEAAASGLPVIATDWSAHTEFLNKGKWVKVDYSLVEIDKSRQDSNIWMAGSRWAQPKEDDSKRKLKKFFTSPSMPKQWAKDLQEVIVKDYNFEQIRKAYEEATRSFM